MDFSVFDSLFDAVFVVNKDLEIKYVNEMGAALVGSSVRRLSRGVKLCSVLDFESEGLFGDEAMPMREMDFFVSSTQKAVKLQVTIQPFDLSGEPCWVSIMHDVTLEETLHSKYQGEIEQKEGYIRELQKAKGQLEEYSKNLERMVEERTQEVRRAHRMLSAIMNSLGQGFLAFDATGECSDIYTRACEDILECKPAKIFIWDVLKLEGVEKEQMQKWVKICFSEALPFDSVIELAPSRYFHSLGRYISLSYYPLRSEDGSIGNVVLVATDETREREAEQALTKEKQFISMVLRMIRNRTQFAQYLSGVKSMIGEVRDLLQSEPETLDFNHAFRILHTIEGESGLFGAYAIRQISRECQEILEPIRGGEVADRASVYQQLKGKVSELEAIYSQFLTENKDIFEALRIGESRNVEVPVRALVEFLSDLRTSGVGTELRQKFKNTMLCQPLGTFVRHFNEVVQHVAEVQGKSILPVRFDCDSVRVSPGYLDSLIATLVHAFRNAVDHGIENAEDRLAAGKPPQGSLEMRARYMMGPTGLRSIEIEIKDDGRGIDSKAIARRLHEKMGLDVSGQSETEIIQHIFSPGFSSRDEVGQFSGRGIGMDAIKTEVERLGGRVKVTSTLGRGTRLILEIPDENSEQAFALSA